MSSRRVAIYGSGRTAGELVRALQHSRHELTGSIVHAAHRAGQDLGDLTIGRPIGLVATADLQAAIRSGSFDVLLYAGLAGESQAEAMAACAEAGVDMVHACFVHPRAALDEELYRRLSDRAAVSGARIVGTGMIPGLWLDVLPTLLASGLPDPVSVQGRRLSDISSWGSDVLRQELGVGARQAGMSARVDLILRESARMIADALDLGEIVLESRGGFILAEAAVRVGQIDVLAGEVEGYGQQVVAVVAGQDRVRLEWVGLADAASRVAGGGAAVDLHLTGGDGTEITLGISPPLDPYPGTAARMVRAVSGIGLLPPGLHPTTALPVA